jgi:hypothetical protein
MDATRTETSIKWSAIHLDRIWRLEPCLRGAAARDTAAFTVSPALVPER